MTLQEKNKWIMNLQKWEHLYVPFSMATRLPFVVCDPDSYNDQVHLFEEKEDVALFAKPYLDQKYTVSGIEVTLEQRLRFFVNLVTIGVNSVVIHRKDKTTAELEMTEIIRLEEDENLPDNQKPLVNPQLQLSGIYFMQAIRRPDADLNDPVLKEMEEEVSANAVRAQYLLPVEVIEEENAEGKKTAKGIRFPYMQDKEQHMIQPVFTDGTELKKFVKEKKMQILKVPFAALSRYATEDSYGFAVNPLGINLIIRKEQIPAMVKRFD